MAQINVEEIIATETSRLCKQFNKSFLDCADIPGWGCCCSSFPWAWRTIENARE